MSTPTLDEAQAKLRQIVASLQTRWRVVLTDNGQPLAKLDQDRTNKLAV